MEFRRGESRVCAKQVVVADAVRISAGNDRTYPGLLEQIPAHAGREQVLPAKGDVRQITCLNVQHPEVVAGLTSDDLCTHSNGYFAAGVLVAMQADAPREERNEIGSTRQAR